MLYLLYSSYRSLLSLSPVTVFVGESHTNKGVSTSVTKKFHVFIIRFLQTLILFACIHVAVLKDYVAVLKDYFAQHVLLHPFRYSTAILTTCATCGALGKAMFRQCLYDLSASFRVLAGIIALSRLFNDNERHFWPFSRILPVWNP